VYYWSYYKVQQRLWICKILEFWRILESYIRMQWASLKRKTFENKLIILEKCLSLRGNRLLNHNCCCSCWSWLNLISSFVKSIIFIVLLIIVFRSQSLYRLKCSSYIIIYYFSIGLVIYFIWHYCSLLSIFK